MYLGIWALQVDPRARLNRMGQMLAEKTLKAPTKQGGKLDAAEAVTNIMQIKFDGSLDSGIFYALEESVDM